MLFEQADLKTALANAGYGLVVRDAAEFMFETTSPKPNEIEKARRKLESLVARSRAERRDDPDGLARYFTTERGV